MKTLGEGFEAFLKNLIPLNSEHEKAASHKQSVKGCLEKKFECYNFFETGSFGNGTGVRHFSDADYFAVCRTANLKGNSGNTLREVKESLQITFPRTQGIEVDRPAVRIPFGNLKSETLEVTPCDYVGMIETPVGNLPQYDIPGYGDEWMRSSPQAHNMFVKQQDERLNGKVKPLIRLLKAWKFYNNVPITSFYLELRVAKFAQNESVIVYDIDLKNIVKELHSINLASIRDPMGISGLVPACNTNFKMEDAISKLNTAVSRAEKAVENRESNLDSCFDWWDKFFGGRFSTR